MTDVFVTIVARADFGDLLAYDDLCRELEISRREVQHLKHRTVRRLGLECGKVLVLERGQGYRVAADGDEYIGESRRYVRKGQQAGRRASGVISNPPRDRFTAEQLRRLDAHEQALKDLHLMHDRLLRRVRRNEEHTQHIEDTLDEKMQAAIDRYLQRKGIAVTAD